LGDTRSGFYYEMNRELNLQKMETRKMMK